MTEINISLKVVNKHKQSNPVTFDVISSRGVRMQRTTGYYLRDPRLMGKLMVKVKKLKKSKTLSNSFPFKFLDIYKGSSHKRINVFTNMFQRVQL